MHPSPSDPQKLARVAELHYEGISPKVIARTLSLDPRAVGQLTRQLDTHPLGLIAMHLAQRSARLQWQARVRRSLEQLTARGTRIPRVARLSRSKFLAQHYAPMKPVVLTGMMRDWAAPKRWTLPYLKAHFGEVPITVADQRTSTAFYDLNVHAISRPTTLGAFVDWILRVKTSNERYLVANNDGLGAPALAPLIRDIGYFGGMMDRRRIKGFVYLWFGPGGTVTPLHHDTTNILFCQVRGRKTFKLVSPLYGELLRDVVSYYSPMDLEAPDPKRYPFAKRMQVLEADLGPGDALFIPAGYWHHVRSQSVSLSVSMTNFVFPNAWPDAPITSG